MATLAALKKKLAALEAQVQQATKAEMGAAITKVKKIMADFGLTIEHLTGSTPAHAPAKRKTKASKPAKAAKGAKPPKYQDPTTGVTWSGVGRAPAWIASAKNRDDFLIGKPAGSGAPAKAGKAASKRAATAKRAKPAPEAETATRKVATAKKAVANVVKAAKKAAPVKRAATKKAAPKKAAGKVARKRASSKPDATQALAATPAAKSAAT